MARKAQNVVVYLRADDVRLLEKHLSEQGWPAAEGTPATWVRGLVRHALDKLREREEGDTPESVAAKAKQARAIIDKAREELG